MIKPSRPMTAILGALLGVALPAGLLVNPAITIAAPSKPPPPAAQVVLSPNTGLPGSPVTVNGTRFSGHESVEVFFDVTPETLVTTSSTGTFQAHLTVPASASPGPHWVRAVGQPSGPSAQAKYTVNFDWLGFRENPSHTGVNPEENVLNASNVSGLTKQWSYTTGGDVESSAIVDEDVVYVGSDDGTVYAINGSTGSLVWSYTTGGSVFSSPTLQEGLSEDTEMIFVGSEDGKVYALTAASGQLRWTYNTGAPVVSSPEVVGNVVYVGSSNDKVYALNTANGSVLWSYATQDIVYSSPAIANGVVYVGSLDGNVYALSATDGSLLWTYTTQDIVYSSPSVVNGIVYVGAYDGNVYALNASTGIAIWVYSTGNAVVSSPAVDNGVVYVGSNDDNLYALNATTGSLEWNDTTGGPVRSSPTVANGVVYIGSDDGTVSAINAVTGSVLWSDTTGGSVFSQPTVADGVLYVGSDDGNEYAFSTPPVVTSTTPLDGTPAVLATVDPSVTFDEAVNITPGAFTLECPTGTPEAFTVAPAAPGGGATYILTPSAPLPAGVVCTVTVIASQVADLGGVAMVANFSFSFTVDVPPVVVSTNPVNGAIAVLATVEPSVTFDKAVNVTTAAFTLYCPAHTAVHFTLIPSAPGGVTTFTLKPSSPLPAGAVCTVTVVAAHVADLIGTDLVANDVFSFTVDTPPVVSATSPLNRATGVPESVDPSVTFNKAVNITSSSFTLQCPAHTSQTFTVAPAAPGGVTTFTLTPTAPLAAGVQCTVAVVASQVTDLAGTPMRANFSFSFTVDTAPLVATTSPRNGATRVPTTVDPKVTFTKAVNITAGTFTLECPSGTPVAFTVSPGAPGGVTAYVLTPSAPLPAGVACTVTVIASQVTDLVGTPMAANRVFSFKIV
jgi:outer membrane protein assembly factor BamB